MKKYVDMHSHSLYSDGNHTVEELITMAKKNNVDFFSITDHNNIESTKDIATHRSDKEITLINGIELSTVYMYEGKEVFIDLLGYDFKTDYPKLLFELSRMKENLCYNNHNFIRKILENNILVPECVTKEIQYSNYRWIIYQIENILIKHSYSEQYIEDFIFRIEKYIPKYDEYEIEITKAIEILHNCGGISVIAHPNKIKLDYDEKEKLIKQLSHHGLDGIESAHSSFSPIDFFKYKELAQKFQLLESVGSDFHFSTPTKNVIIGYGIDDNLLVEDCSVKKHILRRRNKNE